MSHRWRNDAVGSGWLEVVRFTDEFKIMTDVSDGKCSKFRVDREVSVIGTISQIATKRKGFDNCPERWWWWYVLRGRRYPSHWNGMSNSFRGKTES